MITKKNNLIVSFKAPTELTEEEIDEVMKRVNFEAATQRMMDDVIKSGMDSRRPFNTMPQTNIESKDEIEATNKNIDNVVPVFQDVICTTSDDYTRTFVCQFADYIGLCKKNAVVK